jgi:hypothetical protein
MPGPGRRSFSATIVETRPRNFWAGFAWNQSDGRSQPQLSAGGSPPTRSRNNARYGGSAFAWNQSEGW